MGCDPIISVLVLRAAVADQYRYPGFIRLDGAPSGGSNLGYLQMESSSGLYRLVTTVSFGVVPPNTKSTSATKVISPNGFTTSATGFSFQLDPGSATAGYPFLAVGQSHRVKLHSAELIVVASSDSDSPTVASTGFS